VDEPAGERLRARRPRPGKGSRRYTARVWPCSTRGAVAWLLLAATACSATVSAQSRPQPSGRAGTWEVGFDAFAANSDTLSGRGASSLQVDSSLGFGGVAAYNLTNRIAVLGEIDWSRPDYRANLDVENSGIEAINGSLDVRTVLLTGVFYFSASDFSPYLEIGAGWSRIDSSIAGGPPSTGCWSDPWWGYVCAQDFESYHDTRATYTSAFGVRWDIDPTLLLKLSWGALAIDAGARTEQSTRDVFRVEFSWKL
jgi:opacity protein-like surface antigen